MVKGGAVGVLLTDTVYGLVCQAANESAVARLYALKKREGKPGTIIAAKIQQLIDLGLRGRYLKPVEPYWPNPLSVVIPCDDQTTYLHQGQHSLAVRIPAVAALRDFLTQTGPLMTSSANAPGEPTATNIAEAEGYFGDQVDFYVDAGQAPEPVPSTVIRIVDDAVEVLRQGAVTINENGSIRK
jgi:tRNA threonylcarbamoyl adenosine modification protein (Sua5/YciO/YrdC/YwlC family)